MFVASTPIVRTALPFVFFVIAWAGWTAKARRAGAGSTRGYIRQRNRERFLDLKPGWWRLHLAWGFVAWAIIFVVSGFQLVVLAFLPVAMLWVPLWTLAFRWYYRRTGTS